MPQMAVDVYEEDGDMLDGVKRIHLIGIGGIGVSAVARALHGAGYQVQGSDVRESCITTALRDLGMTVTIGHSPQQPGRR